MKEWKTAIVSPYFKRARPGPDKQELQTDVKPTLHLQACRKMHAQTTAESF